MNAVEPRQKLLNAPALLIMSAVIVVALWVLFPRQPAFRNPANLTAKDALSVAYLRVLVQSDPDNAPLRLSLVQLLTDAGLLEEALQVIKPLNDFPHQKLAFETQLADLKLSLQLLYRRPALDEENTLRQHIAPLINRLLIQAPDENKLNEVALLAQQFGEPAVLASTYETLALDAQSNPVRKASWLRLAGIQHLAANAPKKAALAFTRAFDAELNESVRDELAESIMQAWLQAGVNDIALQTSLRIMAVVNVNDRMLALAADIAQPMGDEIHALKWLLELSKTQPENVDLAERIVRLQVNNGLLQDALEHVNLLAQHAPAGSERQRLVAHIYDWNGKVNEALSTWLSIAETQPDAEAESRAFELAKAIPDHERMVQLIDALMQRRELTSTELEQYLKAALTFQLPTVIEQQLRQHAQRFDDPTPTLNALVQLLNLKGEPRAAVAVYQSLAGRLDPNRVMVIAKTYDEAGEPERALDWLLTVLSSPPEKNPAAYWQLLSDLAWELGRDTYTNKALAELLVHQPDNTLVIDRLQKLALRQKDMAELERLAKYGWTRWQRAADLQWLMRFAWQRRDWTALDNLLALGQARLSDMQNAPDYWVFTAVRKMMASQSDAARFALKQALNLRGQDPEITEALIWMLLVEPQTDMVTLEQLVQSYRQQSVVPPPLAEVLALAEHKLGRPAQSAHWFLQSLSVRQNDFFWSLEIADNLEWLGCPAHANAVRYEALLDLERRPALAKSVVHGARLSDYFYGIYDKNYVALTTDQKETLRDLKEAWGIQEPIDNARLLALLNQSERLGLARWEELAKAYRHKNAAVVSSFVAAVGALLPVSPGGPSVSGMLPLSLDDVDYARRWFAGTPPANQAQLLNELDLCKQTLVRLRKTTVAP